MFLLLGGAVVVRVLGATLRPEDRYGFVRAVGWLLSAIAAWMAAAAAGTFPPLWLALAVGAVGALADLVLDHPGLWIVADVLIVLLAGALSRPVVPFWPLAVAAVAIPGVAFFIDQLLARTVRSSERILAVCLALTLLANVGLGGWALYRPTAFHTSLLALREIVRTGQLPHVGLTVPPRSQRVLLPSGTVAWLQAPPGRRPAPGAVLFHGADARGAAQPAAVIARRALVSAGFTVLAVDHPGYGYSPPPAQTSGVQAWDPGLATREAATYLASLESIRGVFAIGHSQGATEVLRLLATSLPLQGAVLFGASLHELGQTSISDYWYERFHRDRRLQFRLSHDAVNTILRRYYDDRRILQGATPDHAAVQFVMFEREHQNVAKRRKPLYDLIPGRKESTLLARSSHYFNAHGDHGVVVGDTRLIRELADIFRRIDRGR